MIVYMCRLQTVSGVKFGLFWRLDLKDRVDKYSTFGTIKKVLDHHVQITVLFPISRKRHESMTYGSRSESQLMANACTRCHGGLTSFRKAKVKTENAGLGDHSEAGLGDAFVMKKD